MVRAFRTKVYRTLNVGESGRPSCSAEPSGILFDGSWRDGSKCTTSCTIEPQGLARLLRLSRVRPIRKTFEFQSVDSIVPLLKTLRRQLNRLQLRRAPGPQP